MLLVKSEYAVLFGLLLSVIWLFRARGSLSPLRAQIGFIKNGVMNSLLQGACLYVFVCLTILHLSDSSAFATNVQRGFGEMEIRIAFIAGAVEAALAIMAAMNNPHPPAV